MSTRIMRGLVAGMGAFVVMGAALVAAPIASASGTLTIAPQTGAGDTALSVTTSGGCASLNATHYLVRLSGGTLTEAITMNGVQPLTAIGAVGSQTTAMTAPVAYTIIMAQENYGSAIPTGVYDLSFVCRSALVPQPIATFTAKITIEQLAGGITFTEGAKEFPIQAVTAPAVTGTAKAGSTLRVSRGTWSPTPDSTTATWKIGTRTVGTGFSYKVKPGDKGKTIKVKVTAVKTGYTTATWTKSIKVAK